MSALATTDRASPIVPVAGRLLIMSFIVLAAVAPARAQSLDEPFLDGLRQRRLFELAESFCRRKLAEPNVAPAAEATYTVELIRSLAQRAVHAPTLERDARWQAARQAAADFAAQRRGHPRLVLVQVQDALTLLAHGEMTRYEAEVSPQPQQAREQALQTIRQAARLLEQIDQQLTQAIATAGRPRTGDGALTQAELVALQHNVHFQLARALRNRALCYPPGSPDRIAALTAAISQLDKPLTQLAPDDPLAAEARLDQAVCYRLLEQAARGQTVLDSLKQPPAALGPRLRAERARMKLAAGDAAAAWELLKQTTTSSAEEDFARLEISVALASAAQTKGDQPQAQQWQQQAVAAVEQIERDHGRYWGRRAELALIRSSGSAGTANVDILTRSAMALLRKGQPEEAIATLDKAAKLAADDGDTQNSFTLAYRAARIEQQRGEHREAADRFTRLALDNARHQYAANAHLAGAWNLSQLARSKPGPETMSACLEALRRHLQRFSGDATCGQAGLWLGQLEQSRQAWPQAIAAYAQVPAESESFDQAIRASGISYRFHLQQLQDQTQDVKPQAEVAARFFEQVILGPQRRIPERWTPTQRHAALLAAEFRLTFGGSATAAEAILRAALQAAPPAPNDWNRRAQMWLIVAIASQPNRVAEANTMLQRVADGPVAEYLTMIEQLAKLRSPATTGAPDPLANLRLTAVGKLSKRMSELTAAQRVTLGRVEAESLAAVGRWEPARTALARLARENPDDGPIQVAYGQLLLRRNDPKWTQEALNQWRIIAKRSPARSPRWIEAKYSIALATYRSGDKKRASELIRLLLATHQLDAPWPQRFEQLLAKCQ